MSEALKTVKIGIGSAKSQDPFRSSATRPEPSFDWLQATAVAPRKATAAQRKNTNGEAGIGVRLRMSATSAPQKGPKVQDRNDNDGMSVAQADVIKDEACRADREDRSQFPIVRHEPSAPTRPRRLSDEISRSGTETRSAIWVRKRNWMMLNCWAAGDDSGACAAIRIEAASAKMPPRARDVICLCMQSVRASGRFVLRFVNKGEFAPPKGREDYFAVSPRT